MKLKITLHKNYKVFPKNCFLVFTSVTLTYNVK